jgi:DNA polymerase III subunit beta
MKVSILQENLAHAVAVASRSASAKASLPVLNHILLSTDAGRLRVAATNLEVGVSYVVGAKVDEEGFLAVPARVLQDLVGSLASGRVELTAVKGSLNLQAANVEANIAGIDGSEFPAIPEFQDAGAIALPSRLLSESVTGVSYAAAADDGRPILTGLLWRLKEEGLMELVATDGYRLARKLVELAVGRPWQVVVPARSLSEVAKIVGELNGRGEAPEEVKISLNEEENQINFLVGTITITSRLLEGQYPPFENIIPKDFAVRGVFDRARLIQSLRLASVFARDRGAVVKFHFSDNGLEISANTAQLGDEKARLDGEVSGGALEVAFNSRYLLDVLGHLGGNQVSFEIKSNLSPGVFRSIGDESLLTLVMPVRQQN